MASYNRERKYSNREICKFYLHGACKFGSGCLFSHNTDSIPNQRSICKYFLMGSCQFGENCFYEHSLPNRSSNRTTDSSSLPSTSSDSSNNSSPTLNFDKGVFKSESEPDGAFAKSNLVTRIKNKPKLLTSLVDAKDDVLVNSKLSPNAPEFKLNQSKSYSSYYEALTGKMLPDNINDIDASELNMFDENYVEYLRRRQNLTQISNLNNQTLLCPYFEKSLECPFEANCEYTHGDLCDMCNMACLHPFDESQREEHKRECMKTIEQDMEEAFAAQCSSEKICGICMEVVWEKENFSDKRFGILENCNHIFCLSCIRKWRASKSYENKIVKACPECRVKSDFVTPNRFWFEDEQKKKVIIEEYKNKLKKTHCKYFKKDGRCPFGNKCFYLHQNKDGTTAILPDPTKRARYNRDGDLERYSNIVTIDFDFSDEDDQFDILEFFRNNVMFDDSDSDYDMELFELADELFL